MSSVEHHVGIVPGIGNRKELFKRAVRKWPRSGLIPHVFEVEWTDKNLDYQAKLDMLTRFIDEQAKENNRVSLLGSSAGASMALNAYLKRSDRVEKVVLVCGRLRTGEENRLSSRIHGIATRISPAYDQSVTIFESNEHNLTEEDRKKIMVVRALWDQYIPRGASNLEGAQHIRTPVPVHSLAISATMIFAKSIKEYLAGD